jgi:mono-ADP-ribosyltransferase sirtuin 6
VYDRPHFVIIIIIFVAIVIIMSAGYAARLSAYPNKGLVGLPELRETQRTLHHKLQKLTALVRKSQHLVILTGAGISTSTGIPDFRGPKGIWTMEKQQQTTTGQRQQKKKRIRKNNEQNEESGDDAPTGGASVNLNQRSQANANTTAHRPPEANASIDFSKGEPMNFSKAETTVTHRAISKLASTGKLKYCVTQNVDGLHRQSGLSRSVHCAPHGCAFTEQCEGCGMEYFQDFEVGGMSSRATGRKCGECDGKLVDTLLDWEDALPEQDFARAEAECNKADLVLCLGTSLRIELAGSLPLQAKQFVIVNKQKTAKDEFASLILHASVDEVMEHFLDELGYEGWKEAGEQPPIEREWRATLPVEEGG